MATKFKIRTSLLEALQKFAAERHHPHYILTCISVSKERLLATSGQRLVSVPVSVADPDGDFSIERIDGDVEEPLLIPGTLVAMHCAAARAVWDETAEDEYGDEYASDFDHNAQTEVSVVDGRVVLEHDGIEMSAPLPDATKFPDTAKLDSVLTSEGTPVVSRFNARFMADVVAVTSASEDQPALVVHAWDRLRTGCGPTEWRTRLGTRLVIMGIAASKEEREALQRIHDAAFHAAVAGERVEA